jgi:hypothetical protein
MLSNYFVALLLDFDLTLIGIVLMTNTETLPAAAVNFMLSTVQSGSLRLVELL